MKVVINSGIGGFGLSKKAMEKLIESGCKGAKKDYDIHNRAFKQIKGALGALKSDDHYHALSVKRDDPLLVKVVEEMGDDADGFHACLKIVEIPDDIEWVVHKADHGAEWIAEKHRTWS